MSGPGSVDLLADGSPVRDEVREVLASWDLGDLAAIQESATAYPGAIWTAFRGRIGPRMTEPDVVRVALEELGAARCPLPVHSGLVQPLAAALPLGGAGTQLRQQLLAGPESYALARPGPEGVIAEREDGRWRLSGHVRHLPYGDSADLLLVPARYGSSGLMMAVVPAGGPGVRRVTNPSMNGDRLTDIEFDGAGLERAPVLAGAAEGQASAEFLGTLAVAAELVGLSARLLEMASERVKSRQAFGAPLAALQGVQLRAADMYLAFVAARDAVAEAASLLGGDASAGEPVDPSRVLTAIAAAKVTATESALAIAAGAHQLCGGWGLLEQARLHVYTRAIKTAESRLGAPRYHRRTIAQYLRA